MAEKKESNENESSILDALKELTKAVADLTKSVSNLKGEWEIFRKAGKF
jgi:hypothetical protein